VRDSLIWVFKDEFHSHKQRWGQGQDIPGQGWHKQSKRHVVSLGTPRNPAGMQYRLCVKRKVRLERAPGLAMIYSSSMRKLFKLKWKWKI